MDILEAKKQLRKEIKLKKAHLSDSQKLQAEEEVLGGLLLDNKIRESHNIIAYSSLPDELPTSNIIKTLIELGHDIYLPVIIGNDLEFHLFEGNDLLETESTYGIKEPQHGKKLPENEPVSIIVPGVAFTIDGKRMGRGKGYYDRFLVKQKNSYKVGVAFLCQKVDDLPIEPFDISMDRVYFG